MIDTKRRHRLSYAFVDGEVIPFDRSKRTRDEVVREYLDNNPAAANRRQDVATINAMVQDNPGHLIIVCRNEKGATLGAYLYSVKFLTDRSIPTALQSLSLPPRTSIVVFAHSDEFTDAIKGEANRFVADPSIRIQIADFLTINPAHSDS